MYAKILFLIILFKIILDDGTTSSQSQNYPIILGWTPFFVIQMMKGWAPSGYINDCPFQCFYTDNRKYQNKASAIVFHARNIQINDLPKWTPEVYNVFFVLESPIHTYDYTTGDDYKRLPRNFFHLTMTYRYDSDVHVPYDYFEPIDRKTKADEKYENFEVERLVNEKTSPVLIFNSNCHTSSGREKFISELKKYIHISEFGGCSYRHCNAECAEDQYKKHYFYLAFENSVCDDYFSEKFWKFKKLIVPIVLDRNVMRNFNESSAFIAASDFVTPKHLADYLKKLMANKNEYMKFFAWTKKYKKTIHDPQLSSYLNNYLYYPNGKGHNERGLCKLCEIVYRKEHRQIPNIVSWWETEGNCQRNYAARLLHNL